MTKTILATGKVFVLIAETKTDTASDTSKCFYIGNSSFSFGRMNSQPHHTAPFTFGKLHGIRRFFISPN
jgi:hypothetical protein